VNHTRQYIKAIADSADWWLGHGTPDGKYCEGGKSRWKIQLAPTERHSVERTRYSLACPGAAFRSPRKTNGSSQDCH